MYTPNVTYILGEGGFPPSDPVMIRKFVQDDHSHSGTPLNPRGSREHQLLGSGYADLLVGDLTGVPSKIQGTGWWFDIFFIFTLKIEGRFPIGLISHFSDGLVQPPTRGAFNRSAKFQNALLLGGSSQLVSS